MKKLALVIFSIFVISSGFSQDTEKTEEESQVKVLIKTDLGDITVVLYNETPQHRDNFIKLIEEGWYEGSPFHRVINGFMIQGGQNADGRPDPGYKVPAEFVEGKFHKKGALSAARQADQVNPERASSGSQFYIVQGKKYTDSELSMMEQRNKMTFTPEQKEIYKEIGGTPFLDNAYTVFGEVIEGFDVIDKIAAVKTGRGDVPVEKISMSVSILEE